MQTWLPGLGGWSAAIFRRLTARGRPAPQVVRKGAVGGCGVIDRPATMQILGHTAIPEIDHLWAVGAGGGYSVPAVLRSANLDNFS